MDITTAAGYSDLDWSEQLGQPVAAEPAVVAAVAAEHILDLGKDSVASRLIRHRLLRRIRILTVAIAGLLLIIWLLRLRAAGVHFFF